MERSRLDVELAMRSLEMLFDEQKSEERPMARTITEIREGYKRLARIVGEYMDGMEG